MIKTQYLSEPYRSISCDLADIELLPKQGYIANFEQPLNSIGFAFDSQCGEHAISTSRLTSFRANSNTLAYVSAGCDMYSQSDQGGEYLKVSIPKGSDFDLDNNRTFNNMRNMRAIRAAHQLRRIILSQQPTDSFEIEFRIYQLINVVKSQLSTNSYMNSMTEDQPLSKRNLNLIKDLIEARLADPINVTTMARLCALSTAYFARAFKRSTGQSPHDYVLNRRITRAREYIKYSDKDLMRIAMDCGFSSHSHLSSAFKTKLGISPSKFRDSLITKPSQLGRFNPSHSD
jgi:AraC family transcriptional regulator